MAIDKRFMVNLQGRDFVLWAGLLDLAHQQGLKRLETALVQAPTPENGMLAIFRAEAVFADGRSFVAHGDASPSNCNPRIAPHFVRMADTRACGRCLRTALNIGMTMAEELGDMTEEADSAVRAPRANSTAPPPRSASREADHKGVRTTAAPAEEKRFTMPDGRELTLKQILTGWERAERDALAAGIEPPELKLLVCEPEDTYQAAMELARRVSEARKAAAAA